MVDSGIPWIGDIPKSWKIVRNKDVFSNSKTLVGENWSKTQLLSLTTKGIKPVAIGSTSGKVPDSYETYQVVEKDNLVMCLFDLDCSAVFSGLSPISGMISPAYKALTIKKGYYSDFYAKWFEYIFDGRKFMFLSKNIRYSLTYDEFAALQIVAPSLSEQQRIAEFLDRKCGEVDEMIALQEQIIEELKAYKQSVITKAVTKGLKPDVSMKDSGIEWIGEIPEHWEVRKLSKVFSFKGGYAFNSDDFKEEGDKQVIRIGNIRNDLLRLDVSPVYISNNIALKAEKSQLEKGQILFTMTGTKGKRDYFYTLLLKDENFDGKELYLNQRVGCFAKKDGVCAGYYNYLLKDSNILDSIFIYETGTANQGNLGIETIKRTMLQYPPEDEQQSIADYLDNKCGEIDELIAIKQSKIDNLKEYKKSIIYEYVTGKREVE